MGRSGYLVSSEADAVYAMQLVALGVDRAETYLEALTLLLKRLCQAGNWVYGEAWAASSDHQSLRRTGAWYGASPEAVRVQEAVQIADEEPEPCLMKALRSGLAQWGCTDELPAGPRAEAMQQVGLQTRVALPVVASGEVAAVLTLYSRDREGRNDPLLRRAGNMIAECAELVQRKREGELLRHTLNELEVAVRERSREVVDLSGRLQQGAMQPQAQAAEADAPLVPAVATPALLQSVLDSMPQGVVVADRDGRVVQFNPAARKMLGDLQANVPVNLWTDLYGLYHADKMTRIDRHEMPLVKALGGASTERMEILVRAGGDERVIAMSARPLARESGAAPEGAVAVLENVPPKRRMRAGMR